MVVRRPQDTIGKGDVDVDTESISRKKKVLVSRRPRTSEEQLFRSNGNRPHHAGAGSGGGFPTNTEKLKWHPDGRVLESSVLGTAAAFEEVHRAGPSKTRRKILTHQNQQNLTHMNQRGITARLTYQPVKCSSTVNSSLIVELSNAECFTMGEH